MRRFGKSKESHYCLLKHIFPDIQIKKFIIILFLKISYLAVLLYNKYVYSYI